ncbi:unnamed protein product [Darwinula stevensoni]|uniref:Bestrophin homolog n=1 Tax=Darwinula stevensoni TaxID=69355 RepID=A0A7R9FQR5_9CRUS|nr:unnamed protein product [Darwinula stevensoni]CAG0899628.1 unnamed protein product [Darwinula stevensoni]
MEDCVWSDASVTKPEKALKYRLAIMRYVHLGIIFCFQTLSTRAERHFGELQNLLDEQCPSCRCEEGKAPHPGTRCRSDESGYIPRMLTSEEKTKLELLCSIYGSDRPPYWVPMVWACRVAEEARREGLVDTNLGLQSIISEIRGVRTRLGQCRDIDNVNIPLVYTQVVTIACYTWWFLSLMASQFIEQDGLDIYFPVFPVMQLVFFMGWLKVAEMLINPFGEDEDDFDVHFIIERNIKMADLIVREVVANLPDIKAFHDAPVEAIIDESHKYEALPNGFLNPPHTRVRLPSVEYRPESHRQATHDIRGRTYEKFVSVQHRDSSPWIPRTDASDVSA